MIPFKDIFDLIILKPKSSLFYFKFWVLLRKCQNFHKFFVTFSEKNVKTMQK